MANPQPDKFVRISAELFDAIMKTRFSGTARMVFDYIIRMTYGYNRKTFETTHYKVAKELNLQRQRVSEAIWWLRNRKMINGTEKRSVLGRNQSTILSIQKDYEAWKNGTEIRACTAKRSVNGTEIGATSFIKTKDNKIHLTNNGTEKRTARKFTPPTGAQLRENGQPWIDAEAWDDFVQHRTEKKKPLTALAVKKSIELLSGFKSRQREIIDTSIRSGWPGIFPPKKPFNYDEINGPRLPILEAPRDGN